MMRFNITLALFGRASGAEVRMIFLITSSPIFSASLIPRAIVARWRPVCFA